MLKMVRKNSCPRDDVVYAAHTQRVIKRELTPSILHLAAFQIGTIVLYWKTAHCVYVTLLLHFIPLCLVAHGSRQLSYTFQRLSKKKLTPSQNAALQEMRRLGEHVGMAATLKI